MSCSKHVPSTISFAEIIHGRDSTVRVTHDRMIYAVDLVMVMNGSDRRYAAQVIFFSRKYPIRAVKNPRMQSASMGNITYAFCIHGTKIAIHSKLMSSVARQVILRIPDHLFDSKKFVERQLSDRGGPMTKLLSFDDAIQLVMVLPGETAKEVRVQFKDILRRYMAGDASMHAEIQANAQSNSPIAQMARESLGIDEQLTGLKRRREELELLKLEEEIKGMAQSRLLCTTAELERIRDPTRSNLDDRTRLMIQDALQNSILNSTHYGMGKTITNGSVTNPSENAPISICSVAAELGYKPSTTDAKRIGIDIKKRYVKLHGHPPSKHDQLCDGRVTQVNSYTVKDKPVLIEALRAYFSPSFSCSDSGTDDLIIN